jgi:hypothetical protein
LTVDAPSPSISYRPAFTLYATVFSTATLNILALGEHSCKRTDAQMTKTISTRHRHRHDRQCTPRRVNDRPAMQLMRYSTANAPSPLQNDRTALKTAANDRRDARMTKCTCTTHRHRDDAECTPRRVLYYCTRPRQPCPGTFSTTSSARRLLKYSTVNAPMNYRPTAKTTKSV